MTFFPGAQGVNPTTPATSISGTPVKTTPAAVSATGGSTTASDSSHAHQSPGGVASRSTATGVITTTETQVVGFTVPANFCQVGTTFRLRGYFHEVFAAGGGIITFRVRFGTTTLTGNIATSVQAQSSATGGGVVEALVTVRSTGAAGTVIGGITLIGDGTAGIFTVSPTNSDTTATVALDTTATKIIELTAISANANASIQFHVATIEVVVM